MHNYACNRPHLVQFSAPFDYEGQCKISSYPPISSFPEKVDETDKQWWWWSKIIYTDVCMFLTSKIKFFDPSSRFLYAANYKKP